MAASGLTPRSRAAPLPRLSKPTAAASGASRQVRRISPLVIAISWECALRQSTARDTTGESSQSVFGMPELGGQAGRSSGLVASNGNERHTIQR